LKATDRAKAKTAPKAKASPRPEAKTTPKVKAAIKAKAIPQAPPKPARKIQAALKWKAGKVAANGIEMAYEEAGPKTGAPVVLIPGLSRQLIHWPESFCQPLVKEGLRVIRIDNRDAGLSSVIKGRVRINLVTATLRRKLGLPVSADYTLYDMAADVVALLDALRIERAHLVGVSMGGMIAQIVAGKAPKRVASLTSIMSTTNHPWLPSAALSVQRFMLSRPKDGSRESVVEREVFFQKLIGSPAYPVAEPQRRLLAEQAHDRAFKPGGILRQTMAIVATGSFERLLSKVKAPTEIIHGTADRMVSPKGGQRSARRIKGARLTMIDGLGHDLPDAVMPRLAAKTIENVARTFTSAIS